MRGRSENVDGPNFSTGDLLTSITLINFLTSLAFREVFDLFDSNGGGTIDAEELDLALKSVDIHLSPEDLQEVLCAMDKDGK